MADGKEAAIPVPVPPATIYIEVVGTTGLVHKFAPGTNAQDIIMFYSGEDCGGVLESEAGIDHLRGDLSPGKYLFNPPRAPRTVVHTCTIL
jgi:hypothetical protein